MAEYSKIKSLIVKNFRCLGSVEIDFEASPIVALVAENEGGKTSVIKAVESLMYNSNQKESKHFIRNGTTGYSVVMEFEDGYVVERERTESKNIYRLKKNGMVLSETLKLDNGEIPPTIKEMMGVLRDEDTGELLNIRTYEDLLLFVLSKDSDNYKTMYNALKVENLTKAIKMGKSEASALKQEISGTEIAIASFNERIRAIHLRDVTPVVNMRVRVQNELAHAEKLYDVGMKVQETAVKEAQLGLQGQLAELLEINLMEASLLESISNARERQAELSKELNLLIPIEAYEIIDTTLLNQLEGVVNRVNSLRELEKANAGSSLYDQLGAVGYESIEKMERLRAEIAKKDTLETSDDNEVAGLELVETKELQLFQQVFGLMNRSLTESKALEEAEREYEQAMVDIRKLGHYDAEIGGFVKSCDNCGETVVITLEEIDAMVADA